MKFHISKVKLIRKRGLELVDLLVKYPENKKIYISYKYIYSHYGVSRFAYNGYVKIRNALILPHVDDIKTHLGIQVSFSKVSNTKLCFKYTFLKNLEKPD